LPDALKERHSTIAWQDVAGAGNVYRHDYENVRELRLWSTVHHSLAPLLAAVEEELGHIGEPP
jgi:uncharacterized protein with HEPN domain